MSPVELVKGLKAGNQEVLADAYHRYHEPLTRYLRKKLYSYAPEAEDLASDTLLGLGKSITSFDWQRASSHEDPLLPWLYRIASRKASDFLRKQKRFVPLQQVESIQHPDDFTEDEPGKSENAVMNVMLDMLKQVISNLDVKERVRWMILTAPYLTNNQKANILGVKETSLSQIRKRLRGKIMDKFKEQLK